MAKLIQGIVPALCTPFDEGGGLSVERVPALVRSLLDARVAGFFVCGSTGEAGSMTVPERKQMAEAAIRAVDGAVPVIVQVGAVDTRGAVELAKHAAAAGADAVATLPPIEAPGDLRAAVKHYAEIGSATDLPFYAYWVSGSAHQAVTVEELLKAMKRVKTFAGFKFTDKDFFRFQQIVDLSGGKLNAITGPDEMCLAGLAMGSDGAIGSTYNVIPRLFVGMYEAFQRGDMKSAMAAQVRANRVIALILEAGVFAGIKAMLGWRGIPVGKPRKPEHCASKKALDKLRRAIESFHFEVS